MEATLTDPHTLTLREVGQNTALVAELFPEDEYFPIVALDDGRIIDGHHRTLLARERGHLIPVVVLTGAQYSALTQAGYDDMQIAWAALQLAGESDAAEGIAAVFGNFGVREQGLEAMGLLEELL